MIMLLQNPNPEPWWYYCVIPLALLLGLLFVFAGSVLVSHNEQQTKAEKLHTYHQNAAHAREMDRQQLLEFIRTVPERERGQLWALYEQKAAYGKEMDDREIWATVNATTVITDGLWHELLEGDNPYAKPRETIQGEVVDEPEESRAIVRRRRPRWAR